MDDGLRSKVEAALRRLPIQADADFQVPHFVQLLFLVRAGPDVAPPAFRRVGLLATRRELKKLERALRNGRDIDQAKNELSQGAILALADVGIMRWMISPQISSAILAVANGPLMTDSRPVTGRRKKSRAQATAAICAISWEQLTGSRPTIRVPFAGGKDYGPFLDFVREIFTLFGIRADAASAARLTVNKRRLAASRTD